MLLQSKISWGRFLNWCLNVRLWLVVEAWVWIVLAKELTSQHQCKPLKAKRIFSKSNWFQKWIPIVFRRNEFLWFSYWQNAFLSAKISNKGKRFKWQQSFCSSIDIDWKLLPLKIVKFVTNILEYQYKIADISSFLPTNKRY